MQVGYLINGLLRNLVLRNLVLRNLVLRNLVLRNLVLRKLGTNAGILRMLAFQRHYAGRNAVSVSDLLRNP
ncbi:MAG: hypothetical protein RBT75_04485 [Anaerolineae bacterium]|nr:hypothetical protein [Anaerolineae bacterium]